jgi:hypothetical protein
MVKPEARVIPVKLMKHFGLPDLKSISRKVTPLVVWLEKVEAKMGNHEKRRYTQPDNEKKSIAGVHKKASPPRAGC